MLHRGTRWVMRVARLSRGQDEAAIAGVLESFTARGFTAAPSRLSRWEYGNSGASARLLRAYEDAGAMAPFVLFALNDRLARTTCEAYAVSASIETTDLLDAADIDAIMDAAIADRDISGSQWYQLASFVGHQNHYYLPQRDAAYAARRLVEELARSVGAGYVLRYEALHLLASQSRIHDALVEHLIEMVEDDSTGYLGDAISLILRASPPVRVTLAERMRDSTSPMVRHSREWIADLHRPPEPDGSVDSGHAARIVDGLCRDLPKWAMAHIECAMTQPLLHEALTAATRGQRHEASVVLMIAGIHRTLVGSLMDAFEEESNRLLRSRLADLLQYQVPSTDGDRLEELALAEEDPEVRRALWYARGHCAEPLKLSGAVLDRLADPASRHGMTYALGMSGSIEHADLEGCDLPPEALGMLAWWKQRGPALTV